MSAADAAADVGVDSDGSMSSAESDFMVVSQLRADVARLEKELAAERLQHATTKEALAAERAASAQNGQLQSENDGALAVEQAEAAHTATKEMLAAEQAAHTAAKERLAAEQAAHTATQEELVLTNDYAEELESALENNSAPSTNVPTPKVGTWGGDCGSAGGGAGSSDAGGGGGGGGRGGMGQEGSATGKAASAQSSKTVPAIAIAAAAAAAAAAATVTSNLTVAPKEVLKCGWLTKKGAGTFGKMSWKKRWFVLRSVQSDGSRGALAYYRTEQGTESAGESSLGVIELANVQGLQNTAFKGHAPECSFAVETKERTYAFVADTALARAAWVSAIQNAMA